MKHKKYLKAFFALIFFGIAGWLSFLKPDWLLYLTVGIGALSFFLILLVFTPAGQVRLGSSENSPSFATWCWQLFKGQCVLFVMTMAAIGAFLGEGPPYVAGDLSFPVVETVLKETGHWQWGIYPWGIYGLWGIIIAYCVYLKNGQPFFYQIARKYCPKKLQPLVKTATESAASAATVSVITLTATSIVLLFSYSLQGIIKVPHFALPVVTVTILFFLTPLCFMRRGRKLLNKVAARGLNWLYGLYIILFVFALFLAALGNTWFMEAYPELYRQSQCPQCREYFGNVPVKVRFAALYWGWWFLWMPLAGSYLAKISMGRSLREFILGLYFIPLLLISTLLFWGNVPLVWVYNHLKLFSAPLILLGLALLTWFILNSLLRAKWHSGFFVSGLMPESSVSADRLWLSSSSKKMGITKYSRSLMMNMLGTLFLHTLAGWYGIQFQVAAVAFPLIGVLYTGFLLLFFWFFRDSVWLNNRNILPFSPQQTAKN